MEFDWNALVNYGALGICLAYFIYKDMKLNKDQTTAINTLNTTVNSLKELVTVVKELLMKGDVK